MVIPLRPDAALLLQRIGKHEALTRRPLASDDSEIIRNEARPRRRVSDSPSAAHRTPRKGRQQSGARDVQEVGVGRSSFGVRSCEPCVVHRVTHAQLSNEGH